MPESLFESHYDQDGYQVHTQEGITTYQYIKSRFRSLRPAIIIAPSPISLLGRLDRQQWLFFLVGFFAWTWDSFDFFTVSLSVEPLAKQFGKSDTDIAWGITIVLMLRFVGSAIFGIASDRFGRKWPFVVNNALLVIIQLATGFCKTYGQFLGVRALFGIAMGGLYGNIAATALEDCSPEARGIVSGLLQQGYALGYLLATAFARALVDTTSAGWGPYHWFSAIPPIFLIILRLRLPETHAYQERIRRRDNDAAAEKSVTAVFVAEAKVVVRRHWVLLIYLVLLMAGFNFMSHGSQDFYPIMLVKQHNFSADEVTMTQVVANLGAIFGGLVVGYGSQVLGRRLAIIIACLMGSTLLYPYTHVDTPRVAAVAFFQQFLIQGAWGTIPIHLLELAPGGFRTFVVGTSYQLGNLISSATSIIEARIGERYPLPAAEDGESQYNYGRAISVFMAFIYAYVIIMAIVGPERLGHKLDIAYDSNMADAANNIMEKRRREDEEKGISSVVDCPTCRGQ